MKTYVLNLFIVDGNKLRLIDLKNYLDHRFGTSINISIFQTTSSMLYKIEKYTNIVILNIPDVDNKESILTSILDINPQTKIIMLSNYEDIGNAIEFFDEKSTDVVIKKHNTLTKKTSLAYKMILQPIFLFVKGFRVFKFPALF